MAVAGKKTEDLLTPQFMHQLDRIDVLSRKVLSGKMKGERRSKKKGQSVEFADYRPYVMGDDLRFIDWNLYARLDKLFLRLFMEEEDQSVSILIDNTASMNFGEPNKLLYARRVAAAIGYLSLVHYNRVNFYTLSHEIIDHLPNLRGRRPIPRMLDYLSRQPDPSVGQPAELAPVLRRFALMQRQKGIVILLSDMLEKQDLSDALKYISGERYDTFVLQLLSPQEIDPTCENLSGELMLTDVEDGQTTEVSVSPSLIKQYKHVVDEYCSQVSHACSRRDIAYLRSSTDVPFDVLILRYLREKGLLG